MPYTWVSLLSDLELLSKMFNVLEHRGSGPLNYEFMIHQN